VAKGLGAAVVPQASSPVADASEAATTTSAHRVGRAGSRLIGK